MTGPDEIYEIEVLANTDAFKRELGQVSRLGDSFGRSLTRAFANIAIKGADVGDTLKSLGLRLSELALKAAFKPLEGALNGVFSGLLGGGFAFANGGVIQNSMPLPFATGGIVSSPTLFPMAGGRTGLMGEAGAEAIMPLARGPDGRLGVRANGGGASGVAITFNITTPDAESFKRSETQIAAMLTRAVGRGQRNL